MPLQTLTDLFALIDQLSMEDRAAAIGRLDDALELAEGPRQLALGLLALDLAPVALARTPVALPA